MSAFDQIVKDLGTESGEDREAKLSGLKKECICPDCPTYNRCAEEAGELLYCFLGRSEKCISEELGCNCPDCPVAARAALSNLYYCINGSELDMRGRK
jgi:hypothetical protein